MNKFSQLLKKWFETEYKKQLDGLANLPIDMVERRQGYLSAMRDMDKQCDEIAKLIREGKD